MQSAAEKKKMASISKIKAAFQNGNQIDISVLEALLEMHDNDPNKVIHFLTAAQGDFVDPGNNANTVPENYMQKPAGFRTSLVTEKARPESEAVKMKKFLLLENTSFSDHMTEQKLRYHHYVATLAILVINKVSLHSTTKAKALAAAWERGDRALSDFMLKQLDTFGFPEVVKACKILDAPRRLRALEHKLKRIENQKTAKKKTIGKLRAKMNEAKTEICAQYPNVSLSGAMCRRIKKWMASFAASELTFFALQLPTQPWKELADMVHPAPNVMALEWFLPFVFGGKPPEDSVVALCKDASVEHLISLVNKNEIPYAYLRSRVTGSLPLESKLRICEYEKLDLVLWYYEELSDGTPEVDNIIETRLVKGEEPGFGYGKFMERLLYFKKVESSFYAKLLPLAQKRLEEIDLPLEPPVVVLGDASYSMDVAIRTATIIASLLTALANADLKFFNDKVVDPICVPRNVQDVVDVAYNTKADGLTAPACALWPYYTKKEIVKCFVMVTDEIENEPYQGMFFAQLFYKYFVEVFPAQLIMVSFTDNNNQKGRMTQALESMGIVPLLFRLDSKRPDLTKVDALLGVLSAESSTFTDRVDGCAKTLKALGLEEMLETLLPNDPLRDQETKTEETKTPTKTEFATLPSMSCSSSCATKLDLAANKTKSKSTDLTATEDDEGCIPHN